MKNARAVLKTVLFCVLVGSLLLTARGADAPAAKSGSAVEVLSRQTPWRMFYAHGPALKREEGKLVVMDLNGRHKNSGFPPGDWMKPAFEDVNWGRGQEHLTEAFLGLFMTRYGRTIENRSWSPTWPVLLCMRARFMVTDPAKVKDLTLNLEFIGGAVIYVNGKELARPHMPAGPIEPLTLAEDYPLEVYVDAAGVPIDGRTRSRTGGPLGERLEKRIRKIHLAVPRDLLIAGPNLLAIELHRSAVIGPLGIGGQYGWSHMSMVDLEFTSAGGAGVLSYADGLKNPVVWNAVPYESIAENPVLKSLTSPFPVGEPVRGMNTGSPFDPVAPLRITTPRNGCGSGQVVLNCPTGLQDIRATLGALTGPGGKTLPATAVRVRYALQQPEVNFCDGFVATPPPTAKVLPVWVLVDAPKEQPAGWYTGTLTLSANGKQWPVAVQVYLASWVMPDRKGYQSLVGLNESPDTVAAYYKLEPWSGKHFAYLEKSLELMGQLGNKVIRVPVVLHDHLGTRTSLIRFVKDGAAVRPAFSALEKYLDLYSKYCAVPKVLALTVWEPRFAKDFTYAYDGGTSQGNNNPKDYPVTVTVLDPSTGKMSAMPAPLIGDEGSETFWKPVFEGVREIVKKRGWSEDILMLGVNFDYRPSQRISKWLTEQAPEYRWTGFSHWSCDPGPNAEGKFIATGGMNVGYQEMVYTPQLPAMFPGDANLQKPKFLLAGAHRFSIFQDSSPHSYRNVAWFCGAVCRHGLDYWKVNGQKLLDMGGPSSARAGRVYNDVPYCVTIPGPEGAEPSVRFQMLREAIQESETWIAVFQKKATLSAAQKQDVDRAYGRAWGRFGWAGAMPPMLFATDLPNCMAEIFNVAGEVHGEKAPAYAPVPGK